MSELQTRFIDDTYVEYYNTGKHDLAQIYLKSEADKVIAELEADKLTLQQRLNVLDSESLRLSQAHNIKIYKCGCLERQISKLEEESRWRKFPDEKPKEDTWCIVFHDGEIDSDHYTRFAYNNKCDFALYGNEVTHWMPLPSAPKEEK